MENKGTSEKHREWDVGNLEEGGHTTVLPIVLFLGLIPNTTPGCTA